MDPPPLLESERTKTGQGPDTGHTPDRFFGSWGGGDDEFLPWCLGHGRC